MKFLVLLIYPLFFTFIFGGTIDAQTTADPPIDAAARTQIIDNLLKELNAAYVIPETAKKMEADVRTRFKNGEYNQITNARDFAGKLTADLYAISRDKHLGVRFSSRAIPVRTISNQPTAAELEAQKMMMRVNNYGFVKVENLPGNVGYIDIRGFSDAESGAETVRAAMSFVSNSDALIFDLRQNGGGEPAMVALICSYLFADKPVHLNGLYSRIKNKTEEYWTQPEKAAIKFTNKPIYILTSSRTFSAAEEFTYDLKNLMRAVIVGETTGGGAHSGEMYRLSDHFEVFIPTERAVNPITKTNWEGTGVEPDVKVSADQALKTAHLLSLKNFLETGRDELLIKAVKQQIELIEKKSASAITAP